MVVGHLPFMGRLVAHLVTGNAQASLVMFRPGAVACLERDSNGDWQLLWLLRPGLTD